MSYKWNSLRLTESSIVDIWADWTSFSHSDQPITILEALLHSDLGIYALDCPELNILTDISKRVAFCLCCLGKKYFFLSKRILHRQNGSQLMLYNRCFALSRMFFFYCKAFCLMMDFCSHPPKIVPCRVQMVADFLKFHWQ